MSGKTQVPVELAHAGDIVCVSKLENIHTGYTISDPKSPIVSQRQKHLNQPYMLLSPKNKQDEDKISGAPFNV